MEGSCGAVGSCARAGAALTAAATTATAAALLTLPSKINSRAPRCWALVKIPHTRRTGAGYPRSVSFPALPEERDKSKAGSAPIRVLVDASIVKPELGGIATYTVGLVRALAAVPGLRLVVATNTPERFALPPGVDVEVLPERTRNFAARTAWRECSLAGLVHKTGAETVLAPSPELALRPMPVPQVMVVHDVGPLVAPAYYGRAKRLRFRMFMPSACSRADAIVCVSTATLLALSAGLGVDPSKCEVIEEDAQALEAPAPGATEKAAYPYLLYVGSLLRHKNVESVLRALAEDPRPPVQLILAGPVSQEERFRVERMCEALCVGDRVRHEGWVSPQRLAALYAGASAVVCPSLHEGFGLPVLEAMRAGVPVITSDIPAVREVADDAALYVRSPLLAHEWRAAVARLLEDRTLQADLAARGRARAARYSWRSAGERFATLLARLARQSPTRG